MTIPNARAQAQAMVPGSERAIARLAMRDLGDAGTSELPKRPRS